MYFVRLCCGFNVMHCLFLWRAEFYELACGCKFVNFGSTLLSRVLIYVISAGRAEAWYRALCMVEGGNNLFICRVQVMFGMLLTFYLDIDSNVWQPAPRSFYFGHRSTSLATDPTTYRKHFVFISRDPRAWRQVQVLQCSHQTQCTLPMVLNTPSWEVSHPP